MKKQFLVIDLNDTSSNYNVDDLNELITELGECDLENGMPFEAVTEWFYQNYKVVEIEGSVNEIN